MKKIVNISFTSATNVHIIDYEVLIVCFNWVTVSVCVCVCVCVGWVNWLLFMFILSVLFCTGSKNESHQVTGANQVTGVFLFLFSFFLLMHIMKTKHTTNWITWIIFVLFGPSCAGSENKSIWQTESPEVCHPHCGTYLHSDRERQECVWVSPDFLQLSAVCRETELTVNHISFHQHR